MRATRIIGERLRNGLWLMMMMMVMFAGEGHCTSIRRETLHLLSKRKDEPATRADFYYGVVGVMVIFLGAGIWISYHQRRARRRARANGQEYPLRNGMFGGGYPNNRRWVMGNWNDYGAGHWATTRQDEGLDDSGEAPPAYKPAEPGRPPLPTAGVSVPDEHIVTIPLETYQRGGPIIHPPAYQSADDLDMARPDFRQPASSSNTANAEAEAEASATRPTASESQPAASENLQTSSPRQIISPSESPPIVSDTATSGPPQTQAQA